MESVELVQKDEKVYAMFFLHTLKIDGVKFLTPTESPLQIGLMERPTGHRVEPHRHPDHTFHVHTMSEFLYIEHGRIKATVYDDEWNILCERELSSGDSLLFLHGGHGIDVIESTRMFEVKQGPYPGLKQSKVYAASL